MEEYKGKTIEELSELLDDLQEQQEVLIDDLDDPDLKEAYDSNEAEIARIKSAMGTTVGSVEQDLEYREEMDAMEKEIDEKDETFVVPEKEVKNSDLENSKFSDIKIDKSIFFGDGGKTKTGIMKNIDLDTYHKMRNAEFNKEVKAGRMEDTDENWERFDEEYFEELYAKGYTIEMAKGGAIYKGHKVKIKDSGKTMKVTDVSKNKKDQVEFSGDEGTYLIGDIEKMEKGGKVFKAPKGWRKTKQDEGQKTYKHKDGREIIVSDSMVGTPSFEVIWEIEKSYNWEDWKTKKFPMNKEGTKKMEEFLTKLMSSSYAKGGEIQPYIEDLNQLAENEVFSYGAVISLDLSKREINKQNRKVYYSIYGDDLSDAISNLLNSDEGDGLYDDDFNKYIMKVEYKKSFAKGGEVDKEYIIRVYENQKDYEFDENYDNVYLDDKAPSKKRAIRKAREIENNKGKKDTWVRVIDNASQYNDEIYSTTFPQGFEKGGDLDWGDEYTIEIWETEEHREHLGPDTIFPDGTTDEEVISEARKFFEDYAAVEVEKNGEVIFHISTDAPKGKRYAKGGEVKWDFSEEEVIDGANNLASALTLVDGKLFQVHDFEYDKGKGAGFELSIDGELYAGGSYYVKADGSMINAAIGGDYVGNVKDSKKELIKIEKPKYEKSLKQKEEYSGDLRYWDERLNDGEEIVVYDKNGVKYIYQGSAYEKSDTIPDAVAVIEGFDESTYRTLPLSEVKTIQVGRIFEKGGETATDYSGEYRDLRTFVMRNGLREAMGKKYGFEAKDYEDYVRGELGFDTEIIQELAGDNYNVEYIERYDEATGRRDKDGEGVIIVSKSFAKGGATDNLKKYYKEQKNEIEKIKNYGNGVYEVAWIPKPSGVKEPTPSGSKEYAEVEANSWKEAVDIVKKGEKEDGFDITKIEVGIDTDGEYLGRFPIEDIINPNKNYPTYAKGGMTGFNKFFDKFKRSDAYISEPRKTAKGNYIVEVEPHDKETSKQMKDYMQSEGIGYSPKPMGKGFYTQFAKGGLLRVLKR